MDYLLAQVNIGRMREPLDSPLLADFVAALDPVNAAADAAPGFIWRLQTEDGNATAVHAFEWDQAGSAGVLVNMSVWESVEALAAYVYSDTHRQVLRRRRQWFERMAEAYAALWWVPRGHIPATDEAEERVLHLRKFGPTPYAFTLKEHFPPPGVAGSGRSAARKSGPAAPDPPSVTGGRTAPPLDRCPAGCGGPARGLAPVRRALAGQAVVIVRLRRFTPADVGIVLALRRQCRIVARLRRADAGRLLRWCCVWRHAAIIPAAADEPAGGHESQRPGRSAVAG